MILDRDRMTGMGSSFGNTLGGDRAFKYFFIHELAHLWDLRHGGELSSGMQAALRDEQNPLNKLGNSPKSVRGTQGDAEDWAEAVASYVYSDVKMWGNLERADSNLTAGHPTESYGNWFDSPTRNQYVGARLRSEIR